MSTANKTPAVPAQAEQPIRKLFSPASAMQMLWDKSSKHLSRRELEWFAEGSIELIGTQTRALADVMDSTACLVSCDDRSGAFQDNANTASLLFNLQSQLSVIAGLANIAEESNYSLRMAMEGGK